MDTRKIRKLIELVKETGIGELEVKFGKESVRICQKGQLTTITQLPQISSSELSPVTIPAATAAAVQLPPEKPFGEGHQVLSPMVGTLYLAPASGAMPFVAVGDRVKVGDTLCLIEAMKMFNKIESDVNGVVSARLVENEQPVEYGQPLFLVEPSE